MPEILIRKLYRKKYHKNLYQKIGWVIFIPEKKSASCQKFKFGYISGIIITNIHRGYLDKLRNNYIDKNTPVDLTSLRVAQETEYLIL